jgi:hypothetical protein
LQETVTPPSSRAVARSVRALTRRLAVLKGWITRKRIRLVDHIKSEAFYVEYQDGHRRAIAWYTSPQGREDADTIRQYLETKAQLRALSEN